MLSLRSIALFIAATWLLAGPLALVLVIAVPLILLMTVGVQGLMRRSMLAQQHQMTDMQGLLVEAMATDNGLGWHNVVSVRISAQVWAQPVPLELLLRTEVDLETGQVALAELAA